MAKFLVVSNSNYIKAKCFVALEEQNQNFPSFLQLPREIHIFFMDLTMSDHVATTCVDRILPDLFWIKSSFWTV